MRDLGASRAVMLAAAVAAAASCKLAETKFPVGEGIEAGATFEPPPARNVNEEGLDRIAAGVNPSRPDAGGAATGGPEAGTPPRPPPPPTGPDAGTRPAPDATAAPRTEAGAPAAMDGGTGDRVSGPGDGGGPGGPGSMGCDLLRQDCGAGLACYPFERAATLCAMAGRLGAGAMCANHTDCQRGLMCVEADGVVKACRAICDTRNPGSCAGTQRCLPVSGQSAGVCYAPPS